MAKSTFDLIPRDTQRVIVPRRWFSYLLIIVCLLFAREGFAQDDRPPSAIAEVTKQVLVDPMTYLPAAVFYSSLQLDWNSSQPFFQNGFVEENARYTRSGRAHDFALSYGEGNRKILTDSLAIVPASMANNALNRVLQRSLNGRFPKQRKLWTTLAWIERAAFASYSTYLVSGPHFEQWKKNERMAKQFGY